MALEWWLLCCFNGLVLTLSLFHGFFLWLSETWGSSRTHKLFNYSRSSAAEELSTEVWAKWIFRFLKWGWSTLKGALMFALPLCPDKIEFSPTNLVYWEPSSLMMPKSFPDTHTHTLFEIICPTCCLCSFSPSTVSPSASSPSYSCMLVR